MRDGDSLKKLDRPSTKFVSRLRAYVGRSRPLSVARSRKAARHKPCATRPWFERAKLSPLGSGAAPGPENPEYSRSSRVPVQDSSLRGMRREPAPVCIGPNHVPGLWSALPKPDSNTQEKM